MVSLFQQRSATSMGRHLPVGASATASAYGPDLEELRRLTGGTRPSIVQVWERTL